MTAFSGGVSDVSGDDGPILIVDAFRFSGAGFAGAGSSREEGSGAMLNSLDFLD